MPYPYVLDEKAYEEYMEAYEWYELELSGLGNRFMYCVEKKLEKIVEHPEYYNKRKGNFREAKVDDFPYMIVYEFFKNKRSIYIAAIYHSKRNPRHKYRRKK